MNNKIIPETTQQLIKELGPEFEFLWEPKKGDTRTFVDRIPKGFLGHEFNKHVERGNIFEKYSGHFELQPTVGAPPQVPQNAWGGFQQAPAPDFSRGFFQSTILLAAYPKKVFELENDTDDSEMTGTYTLTKGTSESNSLSIGMSFNIGAEFGSDFAKSTMELGFSMDATSTHEISSQSEHSVTITVAPGDKVYIYQMVFEWAVIKGRVQKYPDGAWVSIMSIPETFVDRSNYIRTTNDPITSA